MRIVERLQSGTPCFSFEFFPPKSEEGVQSLFRTIAELESLQPGFVSVTYGAGGSTRQRTMELVTEIKSRTGIEAMAHLACLGHSQRELEEILQNLAAAGLENVLPLRGDVPQGAVDFRPAADGFRYASDLVSFVKQRGYDFCLGGACYPEGHLESASREQDLENLKRKVDAGADFLITQLFFDNAFYFHFLERALAAGINCPIVPGIMPLTTFEQIERITRMCGATVPMRLRLELERRKDDPEAIVQLGIAHATLQCAELLSSGVPGIHFYTLNRSRSSRMIVAALQASEFASS